MMHMVSTGMVGEILNINGAARDAVEARGETCELLRLIFPVYRSLPLFVLLASVQEV